MDFWNLAVFVLLGGCFEGVVFFGVLPRFLDGFVTKYLDSGMGSSKNRASKIH